MSHPFKISRVQSVHISSICLLLSIFLCCSVPVGESCFFGGWGHGWDDDDWGGGWGGGWGHNSGWGHGGGGWGHGGGWGWGSGNSWGGHSGGWGGHGNSWGWGGDRHYGTVYGSYNSAPLNSQTGLEGSWRLNDGPIVDGQRPFGSYWSSWTNDDSGHRVRMEIQKIDLKTMGPNGQPLSPGDEQLNIQLVCVNTFYIPVTYLFQKSTWFIRGNAQTTSGHYSDDHMRDMEQVLAYLLFSPDSVTAERGQGREQLIIKKGKISALFTRPWHKKK